MLRVGLRAQDEYLAVLGADPDEGGAETVIRSVPKGQEPLVQQQRPAPGGLAAPEGAHQLVQLAVVERARVDTVWERHIGVWVEQAEQLLGERT